MPFNPDRHHRKSYRLPGHDYRLPGWYFVTVCTQNRECHFGDIVDGRMRLSSIGRIVRDEWRRTARIRRNVSLDEFTIMPNHIHGIIVIDNDGTHCRDEARLVPTGNRISPYANSLAAIVGSFKSACTKSIRTFHPNAPFAWQPRYHDHLLRDADELERTRWYIRTNPERWHRDRNNT